MATTTTASSTAGIPTGLPDLDVTAALLEVLPWVAAVLLGLAGFALVMAWRLRVAAFGPGGGLR